MEVSQRRRIAWEVDEWEGEEVVVGRKREGRRVERVWRSRSERLLTRRSGSGCMPRRGARM